jgi:putative nucleotidyltransferase with HDIG domain
MGDSPPERKSGIPLLAHHNSDVSRGDRQPLAFFLFSYGAALIAASGVLFVVALHKGIGLGAVVPTLVMAVAAFVCEKQSVRLGPNLEASVGFLPGLFAAVALGPVSAMLVVGVGLLANIGRPWIRWAIWTGSRCLVFGAAGFIAHEFTPPNSFIGLFSIVGVASVATIIGEAITGSITVYIRKSAHSATSHCLELLRVSAPGMIVYVPVIAGLDYVYESLSAWAVVLFVGPAIAAQRFFILYRNQRETAAELGRVVGKLERVNLSFATALVTALDARDHYTAGHSAAVAVYSRDIARYIGLSEKEIRQAHLCGLLHDIGKIGVPTGVLEKSGPLASDERLAIETHAEVGASILERIESYEEVALAVRHHHERFDGFGYPDGLLGEDTSILARIVAVADAYSAMTSERPYRVALTKDEAWRRIEEDTGKQFDLRVVEAFARVLEKASEAYVSGTDRDFEIEAGELAVLESSASLASIR